MVKRRQSIDRAPALATNVVVNNTQRAKPPRWLGSVCQRFATRVHGAERIRFGLGGKFLVLSTRTAGAAKFIARPFPARQGDRE